MASDVYDYVLIGGGLTNATAAQTIRARDSGGSILLIGAEKHLPYHRPPLSKEYLRGEVAWDESARIAPADDYAAKRIDLRLGTRATGIDRAAKTVTLSDGAVVRYGKLCLATGSAAQPLDPAQTPGADAPNVLTLRTREDSERLQGFLKPGGRVVIVGAGYIGMEVAADCRQKGLETTVVHRGAYPWDKNTSPVFGDFLRRYYESKGVRFLFGDGVTAIDKDGSGNAVACRTKSGQILPCDFVLAAVGAKLNLDLAKAAGLTLDEKQGVRVNEFLETSDPAIYAAGDIAFFRDLVLDKEWHVEHWQNAEWHGQVAGANLAAKTPAERTPYDHVPWFFSDEFDIHMTLRGDPQAGKQSFVVGRTDVDTDRFLELYTRDDGTLAMAILISKEYDESATAELLEKLVRARAQVGPNREALQAGALSLEDLVPEG